MSTVRTIKVEKPQGDQAITVLLGYEQNYKLDLSAIAREKITLIHIGEKLIILFDNKSTITVEPFFDSMNAPLANVTVESEGRNFTGTEFAGAFPITTDQSVLTAAGAAGAAGGPTSGANFRSATVDPLGVSKPLPLLGQEELPNFTITQQQGVASTASFSGVGNIASSPPNSNPMPGVAPTAGGPAALSVSESALAPSGSGTHLDPDAVSANVSFTAGSETLSLALSTAHLTNAFGMTWNIVNGQIQGFQNGVKVVTFDLTGPTSINPGTTATVTVTETLLAPIDHGATATLDLGKVDVVASDGVNSPVVDQVDAAVVDDQPAAHPVSQALTATSSADTNLMLVLDISGSMQSQSGLNGLTKLQTLQASVNELFEQYDGRGNVAVQIVTFSTSAAEASSNWMSVEDAKSYVGGLTASGNTNYDAAYTTAMTAFGDAGKIPGAQNMLYFLSDGQPNLPAASMGIDSNEQATWTGFLDANLIDAFALGIGADAVASSLDPLAHNGITHADADAILVADLSQLTATLVDIVTAPTLSSNILTGMPPSNFGADGGHILAMSLGGQTFTYDEVTNTLISTGLGTTTSSFDTMTHIATITSATAGTLAIDMDDGHYTYNAPASFNSGQVVQYGYTLIDGDGDTSSSMITLTLNTTSLSPIVRDDHVITNISGGSGTEIVIPDYALLYNDSGPTGLAIATSGITNVNGAMSVAQIPGALKFTDDNTNGGSFTYTAGAGVPFSDTGDVIVDRKTGSTLTGTDLGEILIGRSGAFNVINANHGNDVLIAGVANDRLIGGGGSDLLVGGAGDDKFEYNAISDSTIANHDTIMDFLHGHDELDFTSISGIDATPNSIQGLISGSTNVNAHSIAWVEDSGNTLVYVNTTGSVEAQNLAQMAVLLTGIGLGLTAGDFHHV